MVRWIRRQVRAFSYLPRCFFHSSTSKLATTGQPIGCPDASLGCPNGPIRSPVFLQDIAERKRSDFEGSVRLRKGEW